MKKRYLSKYNLISLMIMFFIVISITLIPKNDVNASSDSIKTSGSWSYKISDGTASIYSYNGSSSSVTVPSTFIYDGTTYKLRKIEDYAFEGNTKLKTVVIPESITSLGYGVFKNCTNLSSVTINGNIGDCNDRSIDWPSEERSVFYNAGTNTASLKVTFGSSVTRIPAYIFATDSSKSDGNYVHITSLVIPSSVTEIGSYAFWNCYDLSSITWGENLKTIETYAFYNNIALKSVSLPSKTTSLEAYAFEGCTGITTVTLPKATKNLGYGVFKNCTNLSSVTINGNVGDCNDRSIDWPSEERSVFYNAGTNTTSLKVTFGSSVTRIPAYIFATDSSKSDGNYVHITSLVIPSSVTEIGSYAFWNCYDLSSITWGENLKTIETYAFYNNIALKSVSLPSKTVSLEAYAFEGCTGITTVTLPKATKNLGYGVFKNCTNLSSVTINGNIGDCNDRSIDWPSEERSVFYNAGTNTTSLKVTFGSSVTRIPAYIFATDSSKSDDNYVHITSLVIPDKVTEIGSYAFNNCYDLKTIKWGNAIQKIDSGAFKNCSELTSITLPSTVKKIGNAAFNGCSKLAKATIKAKKVEYGATVFDNCSESLKIYCYRGSTVATYAKNNSIKYSYLDPANVSISSVSNTSSGVKITWKKAAGASGYYVYRKTQNTGYKRIKTISGAGNLTYTDTAVKDKNGSTYYYTVKAYSSTGSSSSYTTKKIVRLKGISIASLKNTSGKKMYVSWGKNTKCSGYQIQYSTSSSFKSTKTVTVSGYKNVSKTISSLTKGKNYYVRVRAYKKSSNVNYYSAWSTAKSVKISK